MKMIGVCDERLYWRVNRAVAKAAVAGLVDSSRDHRDSRALQHLAQRLPAGAREDEMLVELLEHRAEHQQLFREVVDDQDAGLVAEIVAIVEIAARAGGRRQERWGVLHLRSQPRNTTSRWS